MLKPIDRAMLSNQVFEQLRDGILAGEFKPGEKLPPERELCDIFNVNRSSVREALKRLEQSRLIDIQQGGGSTVLDFNLTAGFDLFPWLVIPGGRLDPLAVRSVLEFKLAICPEIARYAAQRINEPELDRLEQIVEDIEACGNNDIDRYQELDFLFHYEIARASGNLAFILLYNSIRDLYEHGKSFFTAIFQGTIENRHRYRLILDALARRDSESSYRLSRSLSESGNEAFWKLVGEIPDKSRKGIQ